MKSRGEDLKIDFEKQLNPERNCSKMKNNKIPPAAGGKFWSVFKAKTLKKTMKTVLDFSKISRNSKIPQKNFY